MFFARPVLTADLQTLRGWWHRQKLAKTAVLFGFAITLILIISAIYTTAYWYFSLLSEYAVFGRAVATYVLNGSIVLIFILATFSVLVGSYQALFSDPRLKHWLTLPIPASVLVLTISLRLTLVSSWSLVIILLPTLFAYTRAFTLPFGLLEALFVLFGLLLFSQAVGLIILLLLVDLVGRVTRKIWLAIGVLTGLLFIGIARLVFPPQLFKISLLLTQDEFLTQLYDLPLFSSILPSSWLAQTMVDGPGWQTLAFLVLTGGLLVLVVKLIRRTYGKSFWRIQEGSYVATNRASLRHARHYPYSRSPTLSLAINWWYSIYRVKGELIYFGFVMLLTLSFYYVMELVPQERTIEDQWWPLIYTAIIAGLGYLTMVMATRFIYPLMAKQGRAWWFVASRPIAWPVWFDASLMFSVLISLPWLLLAGATAFTLKLPTEQQLVFSFLLMTMMLAIICIQFSFGLLAPNFTETDSAERTSTSGSGMTALVFSIVTIGLASYGWQQLSYDNTNGVYLFASWCVLAVTGLLVGAWFKIGRYDSV